MKVNQTRKTVKVVGSETYINQLTGEIKEMQVISVEERDANFHKLWLEHIVHSLDIIGNQKTKFAFWLLENMNRDNQITFTLRQMAERSKISLDTVRLTVKALIESGFIIRINWGVYQVNPNVIFKGGKYDRLNVLLTYKEMESTKSSDVYVKKDNIKESDIY
jgi:hypothetical protein